MHKHIVSTYWTIAYSCSPQVPITTTWSDLITYIYIYIYIYIYTSPHAGCISWSNAYTYTNNTNIHTSKRRNFHAEKMISKFQMATICLGHDALWWYIACMGPSLWGQHGAHLGPVGPSYSHETCYQNICYIRWYHIFNRCYQLNVIKKYAVLWV